MLTAGELYDHAVDHGNAGRHAAARRALAQAAARHPAPDLAARIEGTRAYLEAETGDPDAAIRRVAAAAAGDGITDHTRAVLASQLGLIELRRGDLASAIPHLTTAIESLGGDPARLGRVALNRGLAHLELGRIDGAERDFAVAAEAFASADDPVERAKAQHNQGYAALMRGDLVDALALMDAARPVLAELSPVSSAVCDLDHAEVLRAAGMPTDAAELLARAAAAFGARRLRQTQADAEYALAATLIDLDPAAATVVARRASRRYRLRGNETGVAKADACRITASVAAGRRDAGLVAEALEVRRSLSDRGLAADATALGLQSARLAVRRGRPDDARSSLAEVALDEHDSIVLRLLAHEVRVELAGADDDPTSVLREAAAGLDELAEWHGAFGSVDLQSTTSVRGRMLAMAGIRAAVGSGDAAVAFEWSERTRSLAGRIVGLRPPADGGTAALITELRTLRLTGADERRQRDLVATIRRRRWTASGSGRVAGLAGLVEVSERLDRDRAALVCYLWSGDRVHAVTLRCIDGRPDVHLTDLGAAAPVEHLLAGLFGDLDMAAAELPGPLARVVASALADRLARLDDLLVAPLGDRLGGPARLVVSAPGLLAGVPWGSLPSLAARAITLPTTVSSWTRSGDRRIGMSSAGFVAGPGVARGDAEVTASASAWHGAEVVMGGHSTSDRLAGLASSVDVLHVVAHGHHWSDNPLFSAVELADGPWFGYDIDELTRVPEVVVLSACEVGRSPAEWGRESLGMAQAWLHAGARCVAASASSVNDEAATALLPRVHALLADGVAPADALAAATRELGTASPFHVLGAGW